MKTVAFACLASLIALPAMADKNPEPKPSGVTIHLFGPNLITTTNSDSAAPDSNAGSASSPASGQSADQSVTINGVSTPLSSGDSASTGSANASPAAAQPEPTMGEVLHEMFVTGDPAQDGHPNFPRGKTGSN